MLLVIGKVSSVREEKYHFLEKLSEPGGVKFFTIYFADFTFETLQKSSQFFSSLFFAGNNKKSNPHFLYFSFQLEVPDKMSCHPLLNQESDEEEERKSDTRMKR